MADSRISSICANYHMIGSESHVFRVELRDVEKSLEEELSQFNFTRSKKDHIYKRKPEENIADYIIPAGLGKLNGTYALRVDKEKETIIDSAWKCEPGNLAMAILLLTSSAVGIFALSKYIPEKQGKYKHFDSAHYA